MSLDNAEEIMIQYLLLKVEQKDWHGVSDAANDLREMYATIIPIKEPLAQPEQEPVARMDEYGDVLSASIDGNGLRNTLYTTPPQRPWVGLTDDEKQAAYIIVDRWSNCVNFIEKTLRKKNK